MTKKRKVARSAKTGEFVTLKQAKRAPATTVVEAVKEPVLPKDWDTFFRPDPKPAKKEKKKKWKR